jgi:protein-disulfide isomerase
MRLDRRHALLATLASWAAAPLLATPARAQSGASDPRLGERSLGKADAPVTVQEFFSLTCSHCAAFQKETWPQVEKELVQTGLVRWVWRDFPLDRTALAAAAVARALPPARYEGFITTLLVNQERWAFRQDWADELAKMAALAGLSRQAFEQLRGDEAYLRGILAGRMEAEKEFKIEATPSFAIQSGGRTKMQNGNVAFDRFKALVEEVRRG